MKVILLLSLLFGFSAFAKDNCEDISSSCLSKSASYMSEVNGKRFCSNVANNCFNAYLSQEGFYGARDKCQNVSASCFNEVKKLYGNENAVQSCSNVSTRCFNMMRASGKSLNESINKCADVYVPCRTCF